MDEDTSPSLWRLAGWWPWLLHRTGRICSGPIPNWETLNRKNFRVISAAIDSGFLPNLATTGVAYLIGSTSATRKRLRIRTPADILFSIKALTPLLCVLRGRFLINA